MAAGEMLVREWIPSQGRVFKETQGCFGLLRRIQSSEVAGTSSVWPSLLPNDARKSLQAANCNCGAFQTDFYLIPHPSSMQSSAQLSAPISSPELMIPLGSQDTATGLHRLLQTDKNAFLTAWAGFCSTWREKNRHPKPAADPWPELEWIFTKGCPRGVQKHKVSMLSTASICSSRNRKLTWTCTLNSKKNHLQR